jgi:hypothetical protein
VTAGLLSNQQHCRNSTVVDLDDTLSDVNTSLETVAMADHATNHRDVTSDEADAGKRVTTLQNDVRNEWINAMFGADFFPLSNSSNAKDADDTTKDGWKDLSIRQGMGKAKMGSYVVYGSLLDPAAAAGNETIDNKNGSGGKDRETPRRNSSANLLKTKSTPLLMSHSVSNLSLGGSLINGDETPPTFDNNHFGTAPNQSRIGATISRIPLGLYFYSVSTNSEAYTLGLRPGSILLSINNIGMLGETSHWALHQFKDSNTNIDNSQIK